MNLEKEIEKLEEISEISNDEVGETIHALLNLYMCKVCLDEQFIAVLEKEILSWYEWAKGLKIIETKHVQTIIVKEIDNNA